MWVTEHGYPGSTPWQVDRFYRGGEKAQADYLAESLPALALAGADQVFVTLRDGGGGPFDSEGIVRGMGQPGGTFARKPAWRVVRDATARWPLSRFSGRNLVARARVQARGGVRARARVRARRMRARGRMRARARVREIKGRSTYRVIVAGRLRGSACDGKLRLTLRRSRLQTVARVVRAAFVSLPASAQVEAAAGAGAAADRPPVPGQRQDRSRQRRDPAGRRAPLTPACSTLALGQILNRTRPAEARPLLQAARALRFRGWGRARPTAAG